MKKILDNKQFKIEKYDSYFDIVLELSNVKSKLFYGIAWNPSDMEQRTGRIDRIDSLAYNKIMQAARSGQSEISFENKLQVFYPYLADTLEVNQMVKLFNGMAEFIELFYSDISKEITKEATTACNRLAGAGFPIENQSVLLRNVNDCPHVIKELNQKLLTIRVRPYYLYQCDLSKCISHFRTSLGKGIQIV